MGKKKKKKGKNKPVKRFRKVRENSPFRFIATKRDNDLPWNIEKYVFDENFKIEVKASGKTYHVSISEKHKCLQVQCTDGTAYIQPVSTATFLIK